MSCVFFSLFLLVGSLILLTKGLMFPMILGLVRGGVRMKKVAQYD